MKSVNIVRGVAAPMSRADIDTDAIIPQNWLITTEREGLGKGLFSNWRYLTDGVTPDPSFVLNRPEFAGAKVVVAGPNYGCGSSREHAVWAHLDFGIEAVISSSFGPIFRDNALKNGLLVVEIDVSIIADWLDVISDGGSVITIDLAGGHVTGPDGSVHRFEMDEERRLALLAGQDDIGKTLEYRDDILAFQDADRGIHPWFWGDQAKPASAAT